MNGFREDTKTTCKSCRTAKTQDLRGGGVGTL